MKLECYSKQWLCTSDPCLIVSNRVHSGFIQNIPEPIEYLVTDPCQLLIIRWVWEGGPRDERCFYFLPESNSIILSTNDLKYIKPFEFIFSKSIENDNSVYVETTFQNLDKLEVVESTDSTKASLLESSSWGSYHFQFGHFIIDTLPYMLLTNSIDRNLSATTELSSWGNEIVSLPPISQPNLSLTRLNMGTKLTFNTNKSQGSYATHVSISALSTQVQFIKMSKRSREKILTSLFKSRNYIYPLQQVSKVVVLSRANDLYNPIGGVRWSNENDIKNLDSDIDITFLSPQRLGVQTTLTMIENISPQVVITAGGSAAYQLFFGEKQYFHVLLIFGSINKFKFWDGQMRDFKPFKHLFWTMYRNSQIPVDWNKPYKYSPSLILNGLKLIQNNSSALNKNFDLASNVIVRSPHYD